MSGAAARTGDLRRKIERLLHKKEVLWGLNKSNRIKSGKSKEYRRRVDKLTASNKWKSVL